MRIINKVDDASYVQWVKEFVRQVIQVSGIECKKVIIEDIEWSKRIFLEIDGEEYTIRTWDFLPLEHDEQGYPCAEIIQYTLFKIVEDDDGSHGEEVCDGNLMIKWKN